MICKRCKVDKPLNETGRCQGCDDYIKDYYQKNRDREIARAQKSLKKKSRKEQNAYKKKLNRQNPLGIILQQARRRAKLKKVPFDITVDDIEVPEFCPVLGLRLAVNEGHAKDNSITIDRIVPELGYVKSNVAIISFKANTIKNNASIEELEKVLKWVKEINEKKVYNHI
jgi:hypothetical protein